ncbi:MAG: T7SS effector LXG polymorphic toxin [Schleiferilactobacillus perolens]|uniref:T7SS effector LXG polymorphic toxin n=1 Tax=Schleiferilactobacillus perolens TaxID=100468 RepID=UPI0039EC15DC
MGFHVDIAEVLRASDSFTREANMLQNQVGEAQMAFSEIGPSEGMRGDTAKAITNDIESIHAPVLQSISNIYSMLHTAYKLQLVRFAEVVRETDQSAVIDEDTLNQVKRTLHSLMESKEELDQATRSIYSSVSDILDLPMSSTGRFKSDYNDAKDVLTHTIDWVHQFEQSSDKELSQMNEMVDRTNHRLSQAEGIADLKYTDVRLISVVNDMAFAKAALENVNQLADARYLLKQKELQAAWLKQKSTIAFWLRIFKVGSHGVDISDHLGELAGLLRNVKFVVTNAGLMIRGAERDISDLVGFIGENSKLLESAGTYEMKISPSNVPIFFSKYILPQIVDLSGKSGLGPEITEEMKNLSFDASSNPIGGFTENVRLVGRNVLGALKEDAKWFNPATYFKSSAELKMGKVGATFSKIGGVLTLVGIAVDVPDEIGRSKKHGLSDGESAVAGTLNAIVINGGNAAVTSGLSAVGSVGGAGLGLFFGGPVGAVAGRAAGGALGWYAGTKVTEFNNTKMTWLGNNSVNDLIRGGIDDGVKNVSDLFQQIGQGVDAAKKNVQSSVNQWIGAE